MGGGVGGSEEKGGALGVGGKVPCGGGGFLPGGL